MDNEMLDFVVKLVASHQAHEEWLLIVRFGLHTLLEDQAFLVELLVDEAEANPTGGSVTDVLPKIMEELNIKFVLA